MAEEIHNFLAWAKAEGLLPAGPERPPLRVDSIRAALWVCRMIEQADAHVSVIEAEREAVLREWDAHVEQEQRKALRVRAWWEPQLEGYLRQQRDAGALGAQKSISLPGGRRLQFRRLSIAYAITDEDAFTSWCLDRGYYRIEPRLSEAKAVFVQGDDHARLGGPARAEVINPQTGEVTVAVVPGVTITRMPGEQFSITLADEGREGV